MKKTDKRSDCPISRTLDIFGDKWTLLILRDIAFKGYNFYNEFLNSEEGIATNVLSSRLKMLEEKEIVICRMVESRKYDRLKKRKEYKLTKLGIGLVPVLLEMLVWGHHFDDTTKVIPEFFERFTNDRESLIQEVTTALENDLNKNFC